MRTIPDIIKDAGGASAIAGASDGRVSIDAIYKWPKIGIPDRHWPLVLPLAKASADELMAANLMARERSAAA